MWRASVLSLVVFWLICPVVTLADDLSRLSPQLLERIERAAPDVLEDAGELILTYGREGQIDAAGIARAVAHQRASRRAREMGLLLAADLDDSGDISSDEIALHAGSYSPRGRVRRLMAHMRADADADGRVTLDELRAYAAVRALDLFDEERAAQWRDLLQCDSDGDGRVSLAEIAEVLAVQAAQQADKTA